MSIVRTESGPNFRLAGLAGGPAWQFAVGPGAQGPVRAVPRAAAMRYATTMVRASPAGSVNGPEDMKNRASTGVWNRKQ